MLAFEEVLLRCRLERVTLERWVALAWVRPLADRGAPQFSDADIARIDLICDLHRDLGIEEDAIEVILPLLDQIYALRGQLRRLNDALAGLPESVRQDILARLDPSGPDR